MDVAVGLAPTKPIDQIGTSQTEAHFNAQLREWYTAVLRVCDTSLWHKPR
jgi:hypothetical protein